MKSRKFKHKTQYGLFIEIRCNSNEKTKRNLKYKNYVQNFIKTYESQNYQKTVKNDKMLIFKVMFLKGFFYLWLKLCIELNAQPEIQNLNEL